MCLLVIFFILGVGVNSYTTQFFGGVEVSLSLPIKYVYTIWHIFSLLER